MDIASFNKLPHPSLKEDPPVPSGHFPFVDPSAHLCHISDPVASAEIIYLAVPDHHIFAVHQFDTVP